jgi:hypothetical protein
MIRRTVRGALTLALLCVSAAATAQTMPGANPYARDPKQPIDQAYTAKMKEYTTAPYFTSPLVDYLPASKTVPTPMAVLKDVAGAPGILPYSHEVYQYMRMVEKASPRVKVLSIGKTEEGREMIAVAVSSEANLAKLDQDKANLAKLADPRTINMNDAEAAKLVASSVPVYYITGTIHSPETGAPTALMELVYRLAVDESPYIQKIRSKVITLITPIVEVDGRDRHVDIYRWHLANPGKNWPGTLYWGHYVAHDNNRDAMGLTLALTRNVLDTYVDFHAQVLHDLHESVPYLYDNTVGDGPYNAWLDPLFTNEWQMIGWHNVQEMTRMGMPGVFAHGDFDTWSPGYLMFMAATHNGISRLYETFGNGGTAETQERTLGADETSRTWFRQNPPLPRVMWSLRNNNNYEQTGILVSLAYFANNRRQFLENFYEKSKRSILKARTEGPAAYVFPADDPRAGAQADLLRILQKQHVEISRATSPFTVALPATTGRSSKADSSRNGRSDTTAAPRTRTFPAGSYVVRMDQPYSRIADALLDYQFWSPDDPQKHPYDDTGWTFPEAFDVRALRITDTTVLHTAMQQVKDSIRAPGGVSGSGSVFAINHNGDNALITLRYRLPKADIQLAEEPFEVGGQKFARGSFIVRGVSASDLDAVTKEIGLRARALAAAPKVKTHPARAPRVAILHTWLGTQTEGWWRQAFDRLKIPYDYINVQEVSRTPQLKTKFDVIIFPPAGGSGMSIIDGMPMWRNAMPWKKSDLTPNIGHLDQTDDMPPGIGLEGLDNLRKFVAAGGVLVGVENTAEFAVDFGLASGVSTHSARNGQVVGSFLRTNTVDGASPIAYGIGDSLAVYSSEGSSFGVSNMASGRSFGGGDNAERATGRGTAKDPDVVQGRPALQPEFEAPDRESVKPWQAAPVTDEQLRYPINIIPPDQRPRVVLRFADAGGLLVSGLLDGGTGIAQRPVVVDVPVEQGHVVLFANNPIWRGETIGSYPLVFNTLLSFDNLDAGRTLDKR